MEVRAVLKECSAWTVAPRKAAPWAPPSPAPATPPTCVRNARILSVTDMSTYIYSLVYSAVFHKLLHSLICFSPTCFFFLQNPQAMRKLVK